MMMNLLEIEDAVKGMSDQQLLREAMNPSGNIPVSYTHLTLPTNREV